MAIATVLPSQDVQFSAFDSPTDTAVNNSLPRYGKPPVVEVAPSVQFDRLSISAAHLGLVWQKFRERFPNIREKPELESIVERFGPRQS